MTSDNKLRALVVDDEDLARHLIREYLQGHADIEIVGECENGLDAVKQIGALAPDLVFLDIQMPRLTGLEVLELTGRRAGVIFTTAYDEHAIKAFDLHAVDYLLKPFSKSRFDDAVARARTL
ncbi:MAG: response regulator, partial [Burkholderiaceae bacterium]